MSSLDIPEPAPRAPLDTNGAHRPRVLLVEDDESHVLALSRSLEREGFAVTAVADGRDAEAAVDRVRPHVILLDVMLPGLSGLDVCRGLRASGWTTPIIIVSSRNEEVDIVVGIEVGADDYVAKPYRVRELIARINALLRRRPVLPVPAEAPPEPDGSLHVGDIVLDSARHELRVHGRVVEVPLREFQLLRELMQHAGRVVTREELIDDVWGIEYDGDPRIIATLVGRLRAKIEPDPERPAYISTIRGVGYRFNDRL